MCPYSVGGLEKKKKKDQIQTCQSHNIFDSYVIYLNNLISYINKIANNELNEILPTGLDLGRKFCPYINVNRYSVL